MKNKILLLMALFLGPIAFAQTVELSWNDNSANEDGFKIERQIDGADFHEIGQTPMDIDFFVDENPQINAVLAYRVLAFNEWGDSGYSNSVTVETKPPTAPDTAIRKRKPLAAISRATGFALGFYLALVI
jgi:hypothetical protein